MMVPEPIPVAEYLAATKYARNRTAYRRGAAFERRVMAQLELLGWQCFRSAGSHSPADVIALRAGRRWEIRAAEDDEPIVLEDTDVLLVQCKAGRGSMTAQAKETFIAFARSCGATACYADQRQGFGVRIVNLETSAELG